MLTRILLAFSLLCSLSSMAQNRFDIKGSILDKTTKESLVGVTVQLLQLPDSSFVKGAAADMEGAFAFQSVKKAKYVLKISSVGYLTIFVDINLQNKNTRNIDLGEILMTDDSNTLSELVVTANAAKVQVSGDSLVYNTSAYKVPEGSTIEALIKLLPGAQVDENGKITINGKEVTKILLNGKEFFLNDMETAMKNIPTDMIEKIKTYEKKSDLARITGVDDGEEETVLDLSVKKGMNTGWFGNITAGAGTHERYDSRGMINRFNETTKVSLVGNLRNTPNRWGWNNGRREDKRIGVNLTDSRTKLETEASVMYRYNGSNVQNMSSSQSFTAKRGAFGESISTSTSSNLGLSANAKLEWKPDTMTNILIRPNFDYSRNRGASNSRSGSYDSDPNVISPDILDYNEMVADISENKMGVMPADDILRNLMDIVVNTNTSVSQSYSTNAGGGLEVQYTRKLNNTGRNITARVNGNYSEGNSKQISAAGITYNTLGTMQRNNRFYKTPYTNGGFGAQLTYNEPIADRTYLQFSYRYNYSYSKNDRMAFIYDSNAYRDLRQSIQENRYDIESVLGFMQQANYMMRDTAKLCQFSEYRNFNQTISLQFRRVRESYNISIGVDAYPQRTVLDYRYMGKEYPEISRTVFNMSPRANIRWNFDKHTNLRLRYQGYSSQPSMTNLLDITDDSNPLNISKGNPDLKPSFTHRVNLNFNSYKPEPQRGMWVWGNFNTTQNSISNQTTYDENGVRTTKPMNINGNWNVGGGAGMNSAIGEAKLFNAGGHFGIGYSHNVGFYNNITANSQADADLKSITGNTWMNGGLSTSFRNEWLYAELKGDINYGHVRNNMNEDANQDTYNFSYGGQVQWTMPWGTQLATDIRMNSRRGYAQENMNTNELLWNASISHSFLQGKALTLKAEMFDILHQQTSISRSVNAFSRNDTSNNTIYQYGMLSLIYRFSIYGGRNTMGTDKERR